MSTGNSQEGIALGNMRVYLHSSVGNCGFRR
jgi:hypothetical protein